MRHFYRRNWYVMRNFGQKVISLTQLYPHLAALVKLGCSFAVKDQAISLEWFHEVVLRCEEAIG